jgi:hypothetical protein
MYMSTSTRFLSRIGLSSAILTVASVAMAQPGLDLLTGGTLSSSLNFINPLSTVLIQGNTQIPSALATSTSAGLFPAPGSTQPLSFLGAPIIQATAIATPALASSPDTPTLNLLFAGASASVMPTMTATYNSVAQRLSYTQSGTATFTLVSGGSTYAYQLSGLSGSVTGATNPLDLNNASGTVTYLGVIPEPTTMALLGTGLLAGAAMRRRRAIKK